MAFFKRALLSLIRRPFRVVVLCLIIAAIGVLELAGIFLNSTASDLKNVSLNKIGAQIALTNKNPMESVDVDELGKCLLDRHILGYNASIINLVTPVSFHNAVSQQKTPFAQEQGIDPNQVRLVGDLNVNMDDVFRKNQAKLISGVYPTGSAQGAVIDQILAEKNHLEIGDNITVRYKGPNQEYTVDIPIVGIYDVSAPLMESVTAPSGKTVYVQSPYSRIFTGFATAKELFGGSDAVGPVDLYVDNINNLNSAIKFIKTIPGMGEKYDVINSTDAAYGQVAGTVEIISHDSVVIILAASLAGIFILFLVIILWMRDYIYDTGVLIALGEKKSRIVLQFLSEVILVAVIALSLSILISTASLKFIGENMINYATQSQYRNAITVMVPDPSLNLMSSFAAKLNIKVLLAFSGIGLLLVIIPTIGSCFSIFRYNPRKVLSKMD
jgi:putative ABC transport system permease protein